MTRLFFCFVFLSLLTKWYNSRFCLVINLYPWMIFCTFFTITYVSQDLLYFFISFLFTRIFCNSLLVILPFVFGAFCIFCCSWIYFFFSIVDYYSRVIFSFLSLPELIFFPWILLKTFSTIFLASCWNLFFPLLLSRAWIFYSFLFTHEWISLSLPPTPLSPSLVQQ